MANAETTKYSDLCRLCCSKTNQMMGIHIFANDGSLRQIDKKIEACLSIQVHEEDDLPKLVCTNCILKLEIFYDFRERCLRTENTLVSLYKQIQRASNLNNSLELKVTDHQDFVTIPHQHSMVHRGAVIVRNEISLGQQCMDLSSHSFCDIDLNGHGLNNQDLSNHGLQSPDTMFLADANVHGMHDHQYSDPSLDLINHEQLGTYDSEQYCLSDLNLVESAIETSNMVKQDVTVGNSDLKDFQIEIPNGESLHKFNLAQGLSKANPTRNAVSIKHKEDALVNNDNSPLKRLVKVNDNDNVDDDVVNPSDDVLMCCNICDKKMKKTDFQAHYNGHFNKCLVCMAFFNNKDTLDVHSVEVHGGTPEKIKEDIKTRRRKYSRTGSKDSDSDDEESTLSKNDEKREAVPNNIANVSKPSWSPKVCDECGKTYRSNSKLAEHMRKHTGEKPYKCRSCEKSFRSKIGLAQHEAKHTGKYDFSCPTCGKGFQCKSYLRVHQRTHSNVKPYPCTTCGQNFKSKQSLINHTNRHLGVTPYMCDICGRGFITRELCKSHKKIHSGTDNRRFSCKVCDKLFVSKSYLQTHLKIHTGEKPFMCEVCGKGFLTRVDLRIHLTMHTGEKSFICEICGKAFARRDALRCHRRSHTGERPYSCDQCGKTFTQFTPMAVHKRLHTGERPFICEVCGRKFISRSTMMSHMKRHVKNDE